MLDFLEIRNDSIKTKYFVLFEEGQPRCDSLCVRFVASAIVVWIRKIGKVLKVVFFLGRIVVREEVFDRSVGGSERS
jgi:hypothetical protein